MARKTQTTETRREYRASHLEATRAYKRASDARHPETRRAYVNANRRKLNVDQRAYRYGLTPTILRQMMHAQDGKCARCDLVFIEGSRKTSSNIDHDHAFAKNDPRGVRALLCSRCNIRIGILESTTISTLRGDFHYIKMHSRRNGA